MKPISAIVASLLLAVASAVPTDVSPVIDERAVNPFTNGTDDPDIRAQWTFMAYADGACQNALVNIVGTTTSGCQNLPQIAQSYRFISNVDPQTGASFSVSLYSSQNCNNLIFTDNGKNGACNTILFESWQVLITT
ncbi:hypothetical protein F5Y04DRAFT_241074 [Hypomontagnella monticulosa]|nr:hypothetical protein F5Y04DRAFT_241074 [Hypomontagnella monticulosa]